MLWLVRFLTVALLAAVLAYTSSVTRASQPSPTPTVSASVSSPPRPAHFRQDREWWLRLTRDEKVRVVEGAIDGLINGWWRAFTEYDTKVQVILMKADVKDVNGRTWLAADNELSKVSEEEEHSVPAFSKKLGFYIDGIDHFYEAYPQATQVTVGEILQRLSDVPWKSCSDVAKIFSSSGQ
jgi:hypothetical protein